MNLVRKLGIYGMAGAIFATISVSGDVAYSANCLPDLTRAENRWNKLRDEKKMTSEFKREVTHKLTLAAELRHQGLNDHCLEQIGKATKEMDLVDSKR
jgi:hypothetical protein